MSFSFENFFALRQTIIQEIVHSPERGLTLTSRESLTERSMTVLMS
jgi:hypothetical protein